MTAYQECDRCHRKVDTRPVHPVPPDEPWLTIAAFTRENADPYRFDLCGRCVRDLVAWVKDDPTQPREGHQPPPPGERSQPDRLTNEDVNAFLLKVGDNPYKLARMAIASENRVAELLGAWRP